MEIVGVGVSVSGGGGRGRRDGEVDLIIGRSFSVLPSIIRSRVPLESQFLAYLESGEALLLFKGGEERGEQLVVAAGAHERSLSFWFQ
uniref:Uncharacterized protein n=1 Tax=Oryza meridionalis TaxID=40149 RepID=A0A0E0EAN5_9ORYZ